MTQLLPIMLLLCAVLSCARHAAVPATSAAGTGTREYALGQLTVRITEGGRAPSPHGPPAGSSLVEVLADRDVIVRQTVPLHPRSGGASGLMVPQHQPLRRHMIAVRPGADGGRLLVIGGDGVRDYPGGRFFTLGGGLFLLAERATAPGDTITVIDARNGLLQCFFSMDTIRVERWYANDRFHFFTYRSLDRVAGQWGADTAWVLVPNLLLQRLVKVERAEMKGPIRQVAYEYEPEQ